MKKIKSHPVLLVSSIVNLLIGLWLIISNPTDIINTIHFIIGGILIFSGLTKVMSNNKSYVYNGLLNIALGIFIILFDHIIITVVLGLLFMVFPILRIASSDRKKEAFKKELPLLIIGLVIAFSGDFFALLLARFFGVLFTLIAVYLFTSIFYNKILIVKSSYKSKTSKRRKINDDNVIDIECEVRESNE